MKNRSVAILLAFFFGFFGIHKFYLGNNFAGIMYFLFSWSLIPGILAFFDLLGLCLMSENAFNGQFNPGYNIPPTINPPSFNPIPHESSREKAATLNELKKLYDKGIITAEEYEAKRRKILDSI